MAVAVGAAQESAAEKVPRVRRSVRGPRWVPPAAGPRVPPAAGPWWRQRGRGLYRRPRRRTGRAFRLCDLKLLLLLELVLPDELAKGFCIKRGYLSLRKRLVLQTPSS